MYANKSGLRLGLECVKSEDGVRVLNHANTRNFKYYVEKGPILE